MDWLRQIWFKLFGLWRGGAREAEMAEEMAAHLDRLTTANQAVGMTPAEARYQALRRFGNLTSIREHARDERRVRWLHDFTRDVRYAARQLRASPGFALTAVLSLAMGIGANTAIFTLINAVLMRPLPGVAHPEELVQLSGFSLSHAKFEALRAENLFANTVAFARRRVSVEVNGSIQPVDVTFVSGDYFRMLGVNAIVGRTLLPDDERTQTAAAVLSHGYWTRTFGADSRIVGSMVRVNGVPVTIAGVTPPEFTGVVVGRRIDLTMPLTAMPLVMPEQAKLLTQRTAHWLSVMGRLKAGQPLQSANARFQTVWPRVLAASAPIGAPQSSGFFQDTRRLLPSATGLSDLRATYTSPLYVLMGLVAVVFLVACANVGSLLVAKGEARQREFAVRLATGADRGRLVRQLLTESLLLATLAALLAVGVAIWCTQILVTVISPETDPVFLDVRPDGRVLGFTLTITLLTLLLSALWPALRATRLDLAPTLKESARSIGAGGWRLRRMLVVGQIGLAMVLAVGAGLFLGSFRSLLSIETGFDAANVLLVRADAIRAGHRGARAVQFYMALLDGVRSLPGVESAAISWAPPVSGGFANSGKVSIEGRAGQSDPIEVFSNFVSPRYFETIRQRLTTGRDFSAGDAAGAPPVVVINQTMARDLFGDERPIGRRLAPWEGNRSVTAEIVGVVQDATRSSLKERASRVMYAPYAQAPEFLQTQSMILHVRSVTPLAAISDEIRGVVRQLDRNVIVEMETLDAHVAKSISRDRLLAALSSVFGVLSLLLVAIGLHGVMAYSVTRRTAEIGIRMALGAPSRTVLSLVLREGALLVLTGVAIGGLAALALGRLVGTLLFQISTRDAATFAGAVGAMAVVAGLATVLPARRATRIDPIRALRHE